MSVRLGGLALAAGALLPACGGPQSALDPAGRDAERIAALFWAMTIGGGLIWLAVMALATYIIYFRKSTFTARAANALILGGGVALPTVVLGGSARFQFFRAAEGARACPAGRSDHLGFGRAVVVARPLSAAGRRADRSGERDPSARRRAGRAAPREP